MPSMKNEKRGAPTSPRSHDLLSSSSSGGADSPTSSGSSGEEEDDDLLERGGGYALSSKSRVFYLCTMRSSSSNRRHRHQIHRGARRVARLMLCTLLVPLLFLLLYLPAIYTTVQTRHAALSDWGYNTSRNIADYVLPENDTTLLEPRNICRDKALVLIVVCSSMHNFAARQAIRETWGNLTEFNYGMFQQLHAHLKGQYLEPTKQRLKYFSEFLRLNKTQKTTTPPATLPVRIVFLIGRSKFETLMGNETIARIRSESQQYDDLIQENFIDTYNNLTLKSVLALKWVTRRCLQQYAYFMKCDDDTFVNIPNLLHFLLGGTLPLYNETLEFYDAHTYQTLSAANRLNSTSNYLTGHLFCTARPVANVSSKWYMPYYMFPDEKYPRYLSGAGYLMSMDVVPRLYEMALNTTFVYLEDVFLTGICADKMRLRRRHHPVFSYTRSKELCSFKGSITQHELKDDSMAEAYAFVANVSNRCPPPGKYFKRIRLRKHNNCV